MIEARTGWWVAALGGVLAACESVSVPTQGEHTVGAPAQLQPERRFPQGTRVGGARLPVPVIFLDAGVVSTRDASPDAGSDETVPPWPPRPTKQCPKCGTKDPKRGWIAAQRQVLGYEYREYAGESGLRIFALLKGGRLLYELSSDWAGFPRIGSSWGRDEFNDAHLQRARTLPKAQQYGFDDPVFLGRVKRAAPWLKPGSDCTGDGRPNLVVLHFTPGLHCCLFLTVFELAPRFRLVDAVGIGHQIYADGGAEPHLVDLDGDGFPEIETNEWGFAYWDASFSMSPAPRVVLKYRKGRFRVATALMRRAPPSRTKLHDVARQIRQTLRVYKHVAPLLWRWLLRLAYTGHARLARQLLRQAWPSRIPGRAKWHRRFRKQLRTCQYWRDVRKMDGPI